MLDLTSASVPAQKISNRDPDNLPISYRLEGKATASRSVCNRNCPHAALMSWPFSRRNVAAAPPPRKIDKNLSCRLRDGRDHSRPSTVLYGIKFTFADSRRACSARRLAWASESLTPAIKIDR